MLPDIQQPSRRAEGEETEAGHDLGPARKVGAPLMLVEVVGDKTVPGRHRELGAGEIERGAENDEPGTILLKQQRKEYNRNPGQGLADGAGSNERLAVGKPSKQFHGSDLGARADQLRQSRQETQLKRACMEEQRERGQILLSAALSDRLAGSVAETVSSASFADIMGNRARRRLDM